MAENPFISVIVPVYNGAKFLPQSLGALAASDYSRFEIIVVDDGSTDQSAEISRAHNALVRTSLRARSGPAAARNLGVQSALGDVLLFVDADVVVEKNTVSKIADYFHAQPQISALFGSYDDAPAATNFLSQYRNLLHHFVHQNSKTEAATFWAGLGAIRRRAFDKVGGFDAAQFPIPSIEDIELGARLCQRGHRILLAKDVQAKHLKKWRADSILLTDIFCRAVPWSKLILTNQGLINDLNLKTSDRLSAVLTGLSIALLPLVIWQPVLANLILLVWLAILLLNRRIFHFFWRKKGVKFAAMTFPWQLLYFFYSGAAFVGCWVWFARSTTFGLRKAKKNHAARIVN